MATVDGAQLAKALNVTPRRVLQLVADGTLKRSKKKFDLVPCMTAYIRFLQNAVEQRQTLTGRAANDVVTRERARLLQQQVQRAERRNLIESGEVVPLDLMRARLSTMIVTARQNLLNMPARIAPQIEGEPRAIIKEKLRLEIFAALSALAVSNNGNESTHEPMSGGDLTSPGPSATGGASIAV